MIEKDNDKHDPHDKEHDKADVNEKRSEGRGQHLTKDAPEITPLAVTLNATTLAAGMLVTDDRIRLTSGATVVAGQMAYADREAMLLLAQVSPTDPTVWLVTRGYSGTPAEAHNSGANVKTGPQQQFLMFNPAGAANAANVIALPVINVLTGDAFDVNAGAWRQVGFGGVAQVNGGVAIGRQPRNPQFDAEGRPIQRRRGRPPKNPPMSKTPDNVVLTHSNPYQPLDADKPAVNGAADFPMAVFHKDSKVGALITRLVESADELKALGKEWGPLKDLHIETAPAAEGN